MARCAGIIAKTRKNKSLTEFATWSYDFTGPQPTIDILSPLSRSEIKARHIVSGSVNPPDRPVQVLVLDRGSEPLFWELQDIPEVQGSVWRVECRFGEIGSPGARPYEIVAVYGSAIKVHKLQWLDPYAVKSTVLSVTRARTLDIRGEASNFVKHGASGEGNAYQPLAEWGCFFGIRFSLYVCNHDYVQTNIKEITFDGSAIDPLLKVTNIVRPPTISLEHAVGKTIVVECVIEMPGKYLSDLRSVNLQHLKVYIFDALGEPHLIQPKPGEGVVYIRT